MGRSVGIYEAKTNLSRLLERVVAGERIVITRNGRAIAELRALEADARSPETIVAEFAALRNRQPKTGTLLRPGETLRDLAHKGHDR